MNKKTKRESVFILSINFFKEYVFLVNENKLTSEENNKIFIRLNIALSC